MLSKAPSYYDPRASFASVFKKAIQGLQPPQRDAAFQNISRVFRSDEGHPSGAPLVRLDHLTGLEEVQRVLDCPDYFTMVTRELSITPDFLGGALRGLRGIESSDDMFDQLESTTDRFRGLLETDRQRADILKQLSPYIQEPGPGEPYRRVWILREPSLCEVLVLFWRPGVISPIHDHGGANGIDVVLQGIMRERTYIIQDTPDHLEKEFRIRTGRFHRAGDALWFGADILHAVEVPEWSQLPLISLHIYLPPQGQVGIYQTSEISRYRGIISRRPADAHDYCI